MKTQEPSQECASKDLACGRNLLVWIVPGIGLVVAASLGGLVATVLWPLLLSFMGGACLLNARRCGRLHCFITGPFFLLLAGVSLLYGLGVLPLGPHGWQWLLSTLLIGGCVLICVPEWLFGRYVRRGPDGRVSSH